ncbi:ABC-2 type transport system permease protein [Hydrogenispora ethanolica]|jgi:ABC-2 type transport system permease protein|uniref:ABC-2 type transport system permease protein n=1 Tax=Hydrogenispora ethanolica TaxID=1082276 RepID=A0A4R1SB11_HYDET|nr:ABC transporter permease [Hydrogenispora ethanolica]TCL76723.1 ABC-2 type transport system permease protein [Hydrogenispora ethanolica]
MGAIIKRELRAYFGTTIGYIFLGFFLLVAGIFFTMVNLLPANPDFNGTLSTINFVFMLVVPVLTMRLFAEESRQKTDQLLFTSPLSLTRIVLGKYFAALTVFLCALLITGLYPLLLNFFGSMATGRIIGGYLGFFLLGACFIAVGLFISSATENQVSAAVITFSALLFCWMAELIAPALPDSGASGLVFMGLVVLGVAWLLFHITRDRYLPFLAGAAGAGSLALVYWLAPGWYDGIVSKVLDWFSLYKRYHNFAQGNLTLGGLVYYLTFATAFVFLTVRQIEKRRWS